MCNIGQPQTSSETSACNIIVFVSIFPQWVSCLTMQCISFTYLIFIVFRILGLLTQLYLLLFFFSLFWRQSLDVRSMCIGSNGVNKYWLALRGIHVYFHLYSPYSVNCITCYVVVYLMCSVVIRCIDVMLSPSDCISLFTLDAVY